MLAFPPLCLQVSSPRRHGAAGALCRAPARRPVHLPRSPCIGCACTFLVHGYGQYLLSPAAAVPDWPLLLFRLRSGAGGILTSAARSVGEVRIPEAERPGHIYPGRAGAGSESWRTVPGSAMASICGGCTTVYRRCALTCVLTISAYREVASTKRIAPKATAAPPMKACSLAWRRRSRTRQAWANSRSQLRRARAWTALADASARP
jgi:hypothetical protein